jgi:hypothetical protein
MFGGGGSLVGHVAIMAPGMWLLKAGCPIAQGNQERVHATFVGACAQPPTDACALRTFEVSSPTGWDLHAVAVVWHLCVGMGMRWGGLGGAMGLVTG